MKRIQTAVSMLNAGVVLYEEFAKRNEGSEGEKERRVSLFIPMAVTFAFGVEVGLKAIIEAQRDVPPHHHDLLKLYRKIQPGAQDRINRVVSVKVPELTDVQILLKEHRKSFETWRYLEDSRGLLMIPLEPMAAILEAIVLVHNTKYGIQVTRHRKNSQVGRDPSEEVQAFASEYARRVFGSGQ